MKPLTPSWRWFGPADPIPLDHIRQTGATGIVTALHHLPPGAAWNDTEIAERNAQIAAAGMSWQVTESIPVSDDIKTRSGSWRDHIDAWAATVEALGRAGVPVVCYNFMPVLDWTRTELWWRHPTGSSALRFDPVDCAMWDIGVLGRAGAEGSYPRFIVEMARERLGASDEARIAAIEHALLAGLPGSDRGYTVDQFRERLAVYRTIDAQTLRRNLCAFIAEIGPVAKSAGVRLAIHPDDPPLSLFGLPRVVSVMSDYERLMSAFDDVTNGITLCAGSLAARHDNNVLSLATRYAKKIHFAHLRNVTREPHGAFHEAPHLEGAVDMAALMTILMDENARRDDPIPFRPDHGHIIGPDADGRFNHGYTFAGRLRGLAELQGLSEGILHAANRSAGAEVAA